MNIKLELHLTSNGWKNIKLNTVVTKDDIVKHIFEYQGVSHFDIETIFQALKHNFNLDYWKLAIRLNQLKANIKYKIVDIVEIVSMYGSKTAVITLIAISTLPIIGAGTIAYNVPSLPDSVKTEIIVNNAKEIVAKDYSKAAKKSAVKKARKQLAVVKKKITILEQTVAVKRNQYKSRLPESVKVNLQEKILKKEAKHNSNLLLSLNEGFYPVPYWDNKQYSVGYGSFISKDDCIKLWHRIGLSEEEGEHLAFTLHSCGYKKATQILKEWRNRSGVLNKTEAEQMRNKEYSKFESHIEETFTYLPDYQKQVLTMTIYNTGWAGFYGGRFDARNKKGQKYIKVMPKSELATCLEKYDWFDSRVYNAYTKLKTYNKGLMNRRTAERDAFFSTTKKSSNIAHNKKLEEAYTFMQ